MILAYSAGSALLVMTVIIVGLSVALCTIKIQQNRSLTQVPTFAGEQVYDEVTLGHVTQSQDVDTHLNVSYATHTHTNAVN